MVQTTIELSVKIHSDLQRIAEDQDTTVQALLENLAEKAVRETFAYEDFKRRASRGDKEKAERIFAKWMKNDPE